MAPAARTACVLLSFCRNFVTAFPVTSLALDQGVFEKLKVPGGQADALATSIILPHMQSFFAEVGNAITLKEGDMAIQASFPDIQVDDDCHHRIKAKNPTATGTLLGGSFLSFGIAEESWGLSVFADAHVNAKLDVHADVCVRTGQEIVGDHCTQIARKTVGIKVFSDGRTGVGLKLTAYDARVTQVAGIWCLVFRFHASVVGKIVSWGVDKVHADDCDIEILGIKILSVCSIIERLIKKQAEKFTNKVTHITAPELLKRLEDKINTSIGSQVVIPLKIGRLPVWECSLLALVVVLLLVLVGVLCRRRGGCWRSGVVVAGGCSLVVVAVLLFRQ